MRDPAHIDAAMVRARQELDASRAEALAVVRELRESAGVYPTSEQVGRALYQMIAVSYKVDDLALLASEALHQSRRGWWQRLIG